MSHNQFQFIGHLTKDAQQAASGQAPMTSFDLAVDRVCRGADGQKQEATDYFRIKCFDALATNAAKYLGKGSQVFIQGHIQPTKYEKDGATVYGHDFIATKIEYLKTNEPGASSGKSK